MARELEQVFLTDARDDGVRAVVVTAPAARSAPGWTLSAEGNVFGLDESLAPTPEEFRERYDEPPYAHGIRDTGGRVTLAIHALPKPVIAAIYAADVLTAEPLEAHLSDSLAMFHTSVADGREGVAAFLEKRRPVFSGRASDLPRVFPR